MYNIIKLLSIIICLIISNILNSQTVIDFKLKVERNNFVGYDKLELRQIVNKGDSIFGIDKNHGVVFSFNKGLTFQKLDYTQKNNKDFQNNNWYSLPVGNERSFRKNIFIKEGNIIIFNESNKLFYESKDWKNFSAINSVKSSVFPNNIEIFNDVCYFTGDSSIYKSSDLRTWSKIALPSFSKYVFGLSYFKDELYLFCENDEYENFIKNGIFKNAVYKFHDNKWEKITGLYFNSYQDQSFKPLNNIRCFNNKIYYENYNKSFVFNFKTNKYDEFGTVKVLTSSLYNDSLFFTTYENKKLMTFFDVINETNIELPKAPLYTCEVYGEYLVVDGLKTIIRPNVEFKLKKELEQRNEESKYWVEKTENNISINGVDRKLSKITYQNQHPVMDKLIPLEKTANGNEISYSPYFTKSSFESKRYVVSSTVNNVTTTKQIHLVNAKSINIFNNKYVTYKIKDYDVYRGDEPYYDEYNRDCDFNLKTVGIQVQTTSSGNEINFFKAHYNETENCIDKIIYPIMESFEYAINGNIETFRIKSYKGGNEIFGFIAETEYKKNLYLFTYDIVNSKLLVTSLNELGIKDYYRYNIKDCTLNKIFRTSDLNRYAYLQFIDKIVPLLIGKNPSPLFAENSVMNAGVVDEFKFNGWSGNIIPLYADTTKEIVSFANYYSDNNEIAKLYSTVKVYDKKLNMIFEKIVIGTKITAIYKYNNHLIIGGFSVDKGYVGFPNPRIIVVNMTSKSITYDKVILQKNGKVENISSDSNGNIEITTSIWSRNWNHSRNINIESFIIFDRLEVNGQFKNNLFE